MLEDLVCETPVDHTANHPPAWYNPHESSTLLRSLEDKWLDNFQLYTEIVEQYMARQRSFPEDVLAAFCGCPEFITPHHRQEAPQGHAT